MFYLLIFCVWMRNNVRPWKLKKKKCLIYESLHFIYFFFRRKASGTLYRVFLIFSFESYIGTNCSARCSKLSYQYNWYLCSCISCRITATLLKASSALPIKTLRYGRNIQKYSQYYTWGFIEIRACVFSQCSFCLG